MEKEKRINARLDLYNQLLTVCDTMNEENESLFILTTSPDAGSFSCLNGNVDLLQGLISAKGNLLNPSEEQEENFKSMQGFILNSAFDILINNDSKRKIFINAFLESFTLEGNKIK